MRKSPICSKAFVIAKKITESIGHIIRFFSARAGRSTINACPYNTFRQSVVRITLQTSITTNLAASTRQIVSFSYKKASVQDSGQYNNQRQLWTKWSGWLHHILDNIQRTMENSSNHRSKQIINDTIWNTGKTNPNKLPIFNGENPRMTATAASIAMVVMVLTAFNSRKESVNKVTNFS